MIVLPELMIFVEFFEVFAEEFVLLITLLDLFESALDFESSDPLDLSELDLSEPDLSELDLSEPDLSESELIVSVLVFSKLLFTKVEFALSSKQFFSKLTELIFSLICVWGDEKSWWSEISPTSLADTDAIEKIKTNKNMDINILFLFKILSPQYIKKEKIN